MAIIFKKDCQNCGRELHFMYINEAVRCPQCGKVYEIKTILVERNPPSPWIFKEGDQWCALYGENIQEGICGFGSTPDKALNDYEQMYWGKL